MAAAPIIDPTNAALGAPAVEGEGDGEAPPLVVLGPAWAISEAALFNADAAAERNEESIDDGRLET